MDIQGGLDLIKIKVSGINMKDLKEVKDELKKIKSHSYDNELFPGLSSQLKSKSRY